MNMDFSISSGMCPVSCMLLKSSHSKSTPSSPRANIISKFTSSGPAGFPVFKFRNIHGTSLSIHGPDLHIIVSFSVSFLSSFNSFLMHSSHLCYISTSSHKIVPSSKRMHFEASIGPFLVISRMMLNISLLLLFLCCSISWHLSSNHLFFSGLTFFLNFCVYFLV